MKKQSPLRCEASRLSKPARTPAAKLPGTLKKRAGKATPASAGLQSASKPSATRTSARGNGADGKHQPRNVPSAAAQTAKAESADVSKAGIKVEAASKFATPTKAPKVIKMKQAARSINTPQSKGEVKTAALATEPLRMPTPLAVQPVEPVAAVPAAVVNGNKAQSEPLPVSGKPRQDAQVPGPIAAKPAEVVPLPAPIIRIDVKEARIAMPKIVLCRKPAQTCTLTQGTVPLIPAGAAAMPSLTYNPGARTNRPGMPSRARRMVFLLTALVLAMLAFRAAADSLWNDGTARPMYVDKRAQQVGDIVTILVQETSTATKGNTTTTSKQSSIDAAIASFLYSPAASGLLTKGGTLPALKASNKSDFSGGGTINNSQQIAASVAVRVVDVLPNHNLVIEGTRESSFSGEQQTIVLRGTIRPDDIQANNTIYSYNVADATIKIISKGTITDAQRKGWFHKLWDKFSPL